MDGTHDDRRLSFGATAEAYERRRPGYPEALYDRLLAAVPDARRVLEAGAGTGKVTAELARRGLQVTAVEPDPAMLAVARRVVTGDVTFVGSAFEDVDAIGFDLVVCAQAWHWIDSQRGGAVARHALRPGGVLALWWNRPTARTGATWEAVGAAYEREAPELLDRQRLHVPMGEEDDRLPLPDGFEGWERDRFPWRAHYDAATYVELLRTHSDHAVLEPGRRERLLAAVAEAVEAHGGSVEHPYDAILRLAWRSGPRRSAA